MRYPQVDLTTPVEIEPARPAKVATKFHVREVVENFQARIVTAKIDLFDDLGNRVGGMAPMRVWSGEAYDAVVPWNDSDLIDRVTQLVTERLAAPAEEGAA